VALFELNRSPSTRELRWFAGLWFPAMCALAGASVWRRFHAPQAAISIWTIAALLAIAGLCAPRVIRPIYTGLIRITFPVGWVLSHVLLFSVYFVVITPLGVLVRRFHDPMARQFDRPAKSYWMPCETRSKESYIRQL
jgi:hypothetical protein